VDVSHDMTRFDAIRLKQLIENHRQHTDSAVAKNILDNWDSFLPKFVKVFPEEYRQALLRLESEELETF